MMAEDMKEKLAKANFKALCEMLDDIKWKYDRNDEDRVISCTAHGDDLPISVRMIINDKLEIVTFYSLMPFEVAEERRAQMALAVTRANNGMVDGCFDFNFAKGSILFRMTACYSGSILSKEALQYILMVSCRTVDDYNDKFLTVSKKDMTVKELFEYIQ